MMIDCRACRSRISTSEYVVPDRVDKRLVKADVCVDERNSGVEITVIAGCGDLGLFEKSLLKAVAEKMFETKPGVE